MMNHSKTPLLSAVLEYVNEDITCFDVPGHKRGNYLDELREIWGDMTLKMDINASKTVDNLSHPTGVIYEAEKLLADAFDADNAFMLVNGSTSGIQYMLMSALKEGDKVLLPRNVHKSAINALILSGTKPVFIQPEIDNEYGIVNGITLKAVKHAVDINNDIKALFVINPTYFGAVSDLKEIIAFAHSMNIKVLVDQAHGTHFSFHPALPVNAAKLGADLVTISMHKTGGSLTQSSVLLHNEGLISKNQVRSTINLLQTTSANYLLMCSLDFARKKLVLEGQERLDVLLKLTLSAKEEINKIAGLKCIIGEDYKTSQKVFHYDDLKIVVKVNDLGLSGFNVYDILANEYGVQVELAEPNVILAIVSFGDTPASINKLIGSLKDISRRYYKTFPPLNIDVSSSLKNPKILMTPRDAYYHPKKLMHITETSGLICGESLMIYPPGIPIVIPGEMITDDMIEHYLYLKDEGTVILNDDDDPYMIQILDKTQEENMIDLWYTENHQDDTKFSIKVNEHIHSEKSEFQQIDFFSSNTFGRFFTLDGFMMVTEKDEFIYHDMISHVPMAVNPDIKRVLIIGGGDGGTAREILRYPSVERVDMVEIDERVVRLCQKFLPQTACKIDRDRRLTLYFEDGLQFVQDAPNNAYDLILVDSTDPIGPGEGLFTYAFYNNCQRILSEDGILINQHESPYYASYAYEMKRAHSKIKDTFPIAKVYQFHMPTYPSGHWLFGFASKKYDPVKDLKADKWQSFGLKTDYYNTDLHIGAFMLPTYVREELENAQHN
jgi:spermidine synthase